MNGVSGYRFGSDPSNIAHIITFSFFMSSKPQKDSLHESSEEATARRKRTLAELKQLSKCYRHNSDLLHATFALRALRSDMRKKLRGREGNGSNAGEYPGKHYLTYAQKHRTNGEEGKQVASYKNNRGYSYTNK